MKNSYDIKLSYKKRYFDCFFPQQRFNLTFFSALYYFLNHNGYVVPGLSILSQQH